jgi:hypothetical protein
MEVMRVFYEVLQRAIISYNNGQRRSGANLFAFYECCTTKMDLNELENVLPVNRPGICLDAELVRT